MARKLLILFLVCSHFLNIGCALLVGKAVYDYGERKRVYPASFDKSIEACIETLASLNIRITDNMPRGISTEIRAEWTDGTPITIIVEMIALKITEVSIRSGMVGVKDKNVCELIHDRILQRLQI